MGAVRPRILIHVFCRIDRQTVEADFIMEVRAGAVSGISRVGDNIAPSDPLTGFDVEP